MENLKPSILCVVILLFAGCSSILPPEAREQVRKNTPEVQSEYSKGAPQTTARSARLSEVLEVGASLDSLYLICGEPDLTRRKGTRLLYESCEGSGRFEVTVRNGRITRIWY